MQIACSYIIIHNGLVNFVVNQLFIQFRNLLIFCGIVHFYCENVEYYKKKKTFVAYLHMRNRFLVEWKGFKSQTTY